jgi:hypothetical protein
VPHLPWSDGAGLSVVDCALLLFALLHSPRCIAAFSIAALWHCCEKCSLAAPLDWYSCSISGRDGSEMQTHDVNAFNRQIVAEMLSTT